jgi:translation initiation factor IF-2
MAGDQFIEVEDATQAREIAQRRERLDREAKSRRTNRSSVTLEDFMKETATGGARDLKLLIKADQGGPAEALADALGQLSNAEVRVDIIQRGVGAITEGDILLAKAAARSSSASTCAPTPRRARPPSARASTSSSTASSTRP